jgi:hypothetical protein
MPVQAQVPYNPEQHYQSLPVSQDELYANAIQEERVKNIISQLDPENQLKEIEMRIRGYKKNYFTQEWEKIDPDTPEPPRILVSRFISYLSSIMNQNTTQGNLSEGQVNSLMKLVIEYISDELDANSEIYNLENNYTERTRLGHIIFNSVFFALSRALNGMEARRMWKSLSLTETSDTSQNKENLKNALKFWK